MNEPDPGRRSVDDPIEQIQIDLRTSVGTEIRRAAEEDEAAARRAMLRGRGLAEVAFELLNRGDTVLVNSGTERFVGVVTYARNDLVTLETTNGDEVHLNFGGPAVLRVTKRSNTGGRPVDPYGPDRFAARLRQIEVDHLMVIVAMPAIGEAIRCYIEAVASDHVMVTDLTGQTWFIPFNQIATVTRRKN